VGVGGTLCRAPGGGGGMGVPNTDVVLTELNSDPHLDASLFLNGQLKDDDTMQYFFNSTVNSTYHDIAVFPTLFLTVTSLYFLA
jgi:hypothetical protein